MNRYMKITSALLLSAAMTHTVLAENDQAPGLGMPLQHRMLDHMSKKLQLSEEQQREIRAIFADVRHDSQDLRRNMQSHRESIEALVHSENYDSGEISVLAKQHAELMSHQIELRAAAGHEVWLLLDEDQRIRMTEFKNNRQHRRSDKFRGIKIK